MNRLKNSILAGVLLLGAALSASAAVNDVFYNTLIPQATDNETDFRHKWYVAQIQSEFGDSYVDATVITSATAAYVVGGTGAVLTGTAAVAASGTTPVALLGSGYLQVSSTGAAVSGTAILKTTPGVFMGVSANVSGTNSKLVLIDGTSSAGTTIATITGLTPATRTIYNTRFTNGLTLIVTGSAASDYTVTFR